MTRALTWLCLLVASTGWAQALPPLPPSAETAPPPPTPDEGWKLPSEVEQPRPPPVTPLPEVAGPTGVAAEVQAPASTSQLVPNRISLFAAKPLGAKNWGVGLLV